jgi:DNA mismatch endonuclease, patch repair protein
MGDVVAPVPRYADFRSASARASAAARGSSIKRDTRAERRLRRALWLRGLRYRIDAGDLPGRPDVVFRRARVAVFCDGDFWHGRDLDSRLRRLKQGHNPDYWVAKIRRNVERDREHRAALIRLGWIVLRYWETDIHADVDRIAEEIASTIIAR